MSNWIKTDNFQLIKKIDNYNFKVIDKKNISSDKQCLIELEVNLKDYSEKEILDILKSYGYESIKYVKEQYKESYLQIIAECIAECMDYEEGNVVCIGTNIDFDNYIKEKMEEK